MAVLVSGFLQFHNRKIPWTLFANKFPDMLRLKKQINGFSPEYHAAKRAEKENQSTCTTAKNIPKTFQFCCVV